MISAKIKLQAKNVANEGTAGEDVQLLFEADYEDERNKEWARFTPALSVAMQVVPEVAEKFKEGQAYTLYFEEADADGQKQDAEAATTELSDGQGSS